MLSRTLDKPRAAVKVELVGGRGKKKTYKVLPGIHIVKPPLTMVERPDALIIDDEGNPLSPEGIFLWFSCAMGSFLLFLVISMVFV